MDSTTCPVCGGPKTIRRVKCLRCFFEERRSIYESPETIRVIELKERGLSVKFISALVGLTTGQIYHRLRVLGNKSFEEDEGRCKRCRIILSECPPHARRHERDEFCGFCIAEFDESVNIRHTYIEVEPDERALAPGWSIWSVTFD